MRSLAKAWTLPSMASNVFLAELIIRLSTSEDITTKRFAASRTTALVSSWRW